MIAYYFMFEILFEIMSNMHEIKCIEGEVKI